MLPNQDLTIPPHLYNLTDWLRMHLLFLRLHLSLTLPIQMFVSWSELWRQNTSEASIPYMCLHHKLCLETQRPATDQTRCNRTADSDMHHNTFAHEERQRLEITSCRRKGLARNS